MAYRQRLIFFGTLCDLLCGFLCLQSQVQPKNTTLEVQAEVGGQVRLPCHHQIQGNITFMYMQMKKPLAYVNGYHHKNDPPPNKMFANRTAVDQSLAWVDLWDVRVTDEGEYQCVLMDESNEPKTLDLYLKVTANYSTPLVTVVHCNESKGGKSCMVTCSSSGGYPNKSVTWTFQPPVAGTQWVEGKENSVQNSVTMLYNVSRGISINCSQPFKITCTVGGAVSQQEEICNTPRHVPFDWMVIAASAVAILFILVVVLMVKKDKACPATDPPEEETGREDIATDIHLLELS